MTWPAPSTLLWIITIVMVAIALAFVLPAFVLPRFTAATLPHAHASTSRFRLSRLALIPVLLLPALAFGLYSIHGDPGAAGTGPGMSALTGDNSQAAPVSRDDLVRHLARSPRDGRGWVLLARMEFASDRFADAANAYANAVAANAKIAADPTVWCEYADALGMAQGGTLAGKPREMLLRALALNPTHPTALEMAGSAAFEAREYGTATKYWRDLLALLPSESRARIQLEAAIVRADKLASR